MEKFYVYLLSNKNHTVFYTGFTNDLFRRVTEHKEKLLPGFTKKYNIDKLFYYEMFTNGEEAKHREKLVKKYTREFKFNLINSINPAWRDLFEEFL